jgi:cell division protein FtsL
MKHTFSAVFSIIGILLMTSLMVYTTSDRVATMEKNLRKINTQIEAERQSLHVLKAEWTYLTNPTRIDGLAKKHLALQPTLPKRVVAAMALASALPVRTADMPTQVADLPAAPAPAASVGAVRKSGPTLAAASRTHINDHVVLQRTAAAEASTDRIGSLIQSMSVGQ